MSKTYILYHCSDKIFNQFNPFSDKINRINNWTGIYFVSEKLIDYAKKHGKYTYICEVNLGNTFKRGEFRPTYQVLNDIRLKLYREYDITYVDSKLDAFLTRGYEPEILSPDEMYYIAKKSGFDSMIDGSIEQGEVCVFNMNNIKIIDIIDNETNLSVKNQNFLNEDEKNQKHIPVISHTSVNALVKQPLFKDAKTGNIRFAKKLVEIICKPDIITNIINSYPTAHLVPLTKKGNNVNLIPYAYALLLKSKNKSFYIDQIYQTNIIKKRGLKAIDRMKTETTFSGDIVKNQKYIILDDVIATGSTIKSLVNYIQERGGIVVLISTIANASNINTGSGNKNFNQTDEMVKLLDSKIGIDQLNNLFKELNMNTTVDNLTNTQIKVLLMYKTIENIKNVLTKSKYNTLNEWFNKIFKKLF
jgi:hypothetical protein